MTKINIILLGESGVGKTTLLLRFQTGEFAESGSAKATCRLDFKVKKITVEGEEVTLFIWDTPGQERYNSLVRSYYKQGEGVLLVYDVTSPESFYKLSSWLNQLRDMNEDAEVLIAGNKNEDPSKNAVGVSAVKSFVQQEKLEYMEMSAKSGKNVEEAFICLARKILIAKGILTDNSAKTQGTDKGKPDKSASKKTVPEKDRDIIRLDSTPEATPSEKKRSCC